MENFNTPTDNFSNKNENGSNEIMDPDKLNNSEANTFTDWKNEPTILDLKQDLDYANQENKEQSENVDGWLALRNATGNESGNKTKLPGRSKVQPKLIRKHNEWRYPALSEPFLNSKKMFVISPRTFEDQKSARQNELVLNYQFDNKLNKVDFIDRMVRTTVDEGSCILRVGWRRETEKVQVTTPIYEFYEIQDEERMQILAMATDLFMKEDPQYDSLPDSLKASVEYSAENKIAVYAEEIDTKTEYETKITKNEPEVRLVNIKNFFIDPSCDGVWQDALFMINTYESTRSNLKKQGTYKNLDKVNWISNEIKSKLGDPDHTSNSPQVDNRTNRDKAKVLVHEYWGYFDIHGNGNLTPITVSWIGDVIIQMHENPFPDRKPPFIIIPYMPILNSSFGEADASLLQDNQRILGAVSRGTIDLLGRSANAQTGYAKGFLDPVNKKRFINGEDFEYNPNGDPRQQIQQLKYPEISNSALQMSSIQNAEAEGLSGVKGFSSGITGNAYGDVARGITGALDAAGQREMSILRRLSEGMTILGKKFVSMNQKYLKDKEVIRITNEEFIEINKEDLSGNFDLVVDISTQNVDEMKAKDLGFMLQTQGPNMDPGLEQIILAEIADLKRMPHLAERIRSYQPQPDPLEEKQKELTIAKLDADIELDKARALEAQARAENVALETDMNLKGITHNRNLENSGAQARGNRDLEVTKKLLEGNTAAGNIEAAVGYNKITEANNEQDTDLPLAPLQSLSQENQQVPELQEINNINNPIAFPN